ncbi:hypothetical protein [Patulibacter sp. SYSU D01012]|uniref:hypothetical protein n=1 Tax=Patulibacter sp. SYSU D01012 TaxID=2817381 RepID=UPI001B30820E|nr:hypothetical protein [Patulibacter sp. SYSU D01012]
MSGAAFAVRPRRPEDDAAWDALVARARIPTVLLRTGYLAYHADRFADASLLVHEGDALRAALPLSRHGDEVVSHGGLTFGGLITDDAASATRVAAWLEACAERLRADGVRRLVYKPAPHIYHRRPAEEDLHALWALGARLVRRDLSTTIRTADRPPFAKGRRAAVKKARDLHVARDPDLHGYWALEEATLLGRHGVRPVHTADEIALLAARFPDEIALYTAREAPGAPVLAGVVVYATPLVAHTQYIAAGPEGRARGGVDAIVDHLLREVHPATPWFDFGISTVDEGRTLNAGLVRNKESYGGSTTVYDRYVLDL